MQFLRTILLSNNLVLMAWSKTFYSGLLWYSHGKPHSVPGEWRGIRADLVYVVCGLRLYNVYIELSYPPVFTHPQHTYHHSDKHIQCILAQTHLLSFIYHNQQTPPPTMHTQTLLSPHYFTVLYIPHTFLPLDTITQSLCSLSLHTLLLCHPSHTPQPSPSPLTHLTSLPLMTLTRHPSSTHPLSFPQLLRALYSLVFTTTSTLILANVENQRLEAITT